MLASIRRKAKIKEGDSLEVFVDADGTIRLVPKLTEEYQFDDVEWALKHSKKK